MMLLIGILIVPFSIMIISLIRNFKTSTKKRIMYNLLLFLISMIFIITTFLVNMDPFKFEIKTSEDYLIYVAIIFMFTPFLWIHLYQHLSYIFRSLRVKKNSKIKDKNQFKYYRDDLDKLSPGLLMFIRNFEIDMKKAISSSILKLKLTKNIKEEKGKLKISDKNDSLINSEKMVLKLVSNDDFDERKYVEEIKNEAIKYGYLKKSFKSIFFKIPLIFLTIIIPIITLVISIKFDNYVFSKYKFYLKDGERYLLVSDEIGDIHFDHPKNINDYYHGYIKEEKRIFYDKSLINTKKTNYPEVKKAITLHTLDLIGFCLTMVIIFVSIYKLIEQLLYINKSYIRTQKGTDVLNKSYALKNFLEDFSDIKSKKEEEIILWEYYLLYATVLGINVSINDKLIKKYVN